VKRLAALLLVLAGFAVAAQESGGPDAVLLVAKPGLPDPRFAQAVVLVTRTSERQTVGVILNKPLRARLAELVTEPELARNYAGPVFFGGPVLERTLVALFRSAGEPPAPAFHVGEGVWLSMHPGNVERLLRAGGPGYPGQYRVYAGFSAWAPGQLESELERDSWYVLPVSESVLFRADPDGLLEELLERARGRRAALY
jgi:putative transcriptional regulator